MNFRHLPKRVQAYFLLLINTLTWGAALVVVKPGLEFATPFRFLLYRYWLAIILCLPILLFYYYRKSVKNWNKTVLVVAGVELIGTVFALSCLYFGLQRTTAIEASLITTASPLFTTLAGIIWLRERQEKNEWLGLAIALAGTILLTLVPLIQSQFGLVVHISLLGNLLILAHNIASAGYYILAKKYYAKLPKLLTSTISFYVGLVAFFILSLWEVGWDWSSLLSASLHDLTFPSVWVASGYMAIFGSIIGLTAYIKGQDLIETSEASWFWYLQPLVFIPLGVWWLGETVHPLQLTALAIIFVGVFLAEKRFRKIKPVRKHTQTPKLRMARHR